MGRYFAELHCTGFFSFISVLYSNSSNVFFPMDLTDGRAPRFEKVSLETKYNIVVGTQTVLKPTLLDGLHKLTPEQVWRGADWGFSAAEGHWRHFPVTFYVCEWIDGQDSEDHWSTGHINDGLWCLDRVEYVRWSFWSGAPAIWPPLQKCCNLSTLGFPFPVPSLVKKIPLEVHSIVKCTSSYGCVEKFYIEKSQLEVSKFVSL